jgi:excisionase family DNA binding protein
MAHLSVREAAAELGVHPARVTHWIASGRLRAEWVDGPHGRARRIDSDTLAALRREMARERESSEAEPAAGLSDSGPDSLARARAVESYTAGLAATAIAPAVSRLVETIEQLTRENGDLREEIGALKARLAARASAEHGDAEVETGYVPASGPNGLSDDQWQSLRERLDRLSQPLTDTGPSDPDPPPARREDHATLPRRRRRPSPWARLTSWMREIRA